MGLGHDASTPSLKPPGRLPAALLVRAATLLLWAAVLLGAVTGPAALLLDQTPPTASTATPASSSTAAEGFAELFVSTYLGQAGRDTEDVLEPFLAEPVDLGEVTPGGWYVVRTAPVAAEDLDGGYWAVTVAAEVLTSVDGGYQPAGVRYFRVGVVDARDGLVATGLPTQVPTPTRADPPPLTVAQLSAPDDDPRTAAIARFIAAYLAGDGEIERYTTPDAEIAAVTPAPYAVATVRRLGAAELADGDVRVRVEIEAVTAAGLTHVQHHSLVLSRRAGRWEVDRVDPAPPLSTP